MGASAIALLAGLATFAWDESGAFRVTSTVSSQSGGPQGSEIGSMTASVVDSQTSKIAPAPVFIQCSIPTGLASLVTSGTYYTAAEHEYQFEHEIISGPGGLWTAFTSHDNLVTGWNKPQEGAGREVAFCLPLPGTYTIRSRAIDRNWNYAETTTEVVVVDKSTVITQTFVYSESGFTGAPSGTQFTDAASLETAIRAATEPTEILFKGGDTITDFYCGPGAGQLYYVGTWGSGKATITPSTAGENPASFGFGSDGFTNHSQVTIEGIKFHGTWDAATETGHPGMRSWLAITNKQTHLAMFHQCEWDGNETVYPGSDNAGHRIMYSDCTITNWRHYGILAAELDRLAIIGCKITQDPLALSGGERDELTNDHVPVRISAVNEHCYIWACEMFNVAGWNYPNQPIVSQQPALRVDHLGTLGASYYIANTILEGGYRIVKHEGQNPTAPDNPGNYIFDRVLFLGSSKTDTCIGMHRGGTTLRSCYLCKPNCAPYSSGGYTVNFLVFVALQPDNSQNGNVDEPVRYINCTGAYLGDDLSSAPAWEGGTDPFTDKQFDNCVRHSPNSTTPYSEGTMSQYTIPGFQPRSQYARPSYYKEVFAIIDFSASAIGNGDTLTIPMSAITTDHFDVGTSRGSGTATDQTYWDAVVAAGNDLHKIRVDTIVYQADRGDISVSFTGGNILITNNTGTTWNTSDDLRLSLDRRVHMDNDLPLNTANATPTALPYFVPTAGAAATADTSASVQRAYRDFFGQLVSTDAPQGAFYAQAA